MSARSLATMLPKVSSPVFRPFVIAVEFAETLVILTENFLGFALSMVTPEIVVAVALHCEPAGAQNSLKPATSWKLDLRTVFADLPVAMRPVSQSCAMIGLPADQLALSLIVNV